jgi:hypothetical protein
MESPVTGAPLFQFPEVIKLPELTLEVVFPRSWKEISAQEKSRRALNWFMPLVPIKYSTS